MTAALVKSTCTQEAVREPMIYLGVNRLRDVIVKGRGQFVIGWQAFSGFTMSLHNHRAWQMLNQSIEAKQMHWGFKRKALIANAHLIQVPFLPKLTIPILYRQTI